MDDVGFLQALPTWVQIAGFLLSAGIGGVLFKFYDRKKSSDDPQNMTLLEEFREDRREMRLDIKELRKEIKALREENTRLEIEITKLRHELEIFESTAGYSPLPSWRKTLDGTMLWLNEAYEKRFLLPMGKTKSDYISHKDPEVWGEEIGRRFQAHDVEVVRTGKIATFMEEFPVEGVMERWLIIKYPARLSKDGPVVGVGGVAVVSMSELHKLSYNHADDQDLTMVDDYVKEY